MESAMKPIEREEHSWRVSYPQDCVRYIEAFRRHYWDHQGVCRLLEEFFSTRSDVQSICELGSGAGTNLMYLSRSGYSCFGYDANKESISISQERANQAGQDIEFTLLDFTSELPKRTFDAVLSLFVPISLADMESLALRAREIIRPDGYFACMLLAVLPEFADQTDNDVNTNEFLEVDGVDVLRMNFFHKRGHQISFDGVYLANEEGGIRMFRDRDRYDLLTSFEQKLNLPSNLYRHVDRYRIYGKKDQCPPMTYEVLDILQRVED